MTTNRMGLEQTLSDERLEQIAKEAVSAERIAMARELLAYRKASKPIECSKDLYEWLTKLADMKYCHSNPGHWLLGLKDTNKLANLALRAVTMPTPLQAVTVPDERVTWSDDGGHIKYTDFDAGWNACRAAMLKSVTNEP